jgi:hypothetical protein
MGLKKERIYAPFSLVNNDIYLPEGTYLSDDQASVSAAEAEEACSFSAACRIMIIKASNS